MIDSFSRAGLIAALSLVLLVAACDREDDSALTSDAGILRHVPADTPFLIATPGPFPEDVVDKLEPQIDATLKSYHRLIVAFVDAAVAEARAEGEDVTSFEEAMPFIDELGTLMSVDGLEAAGIDRDSRIALYGLGVLPVLRISLSDGALMEQTIARLEEQAGKEMMVASVGGQEYRYAGDDEAQFIVAIAGDELVVSLIPSGLSDEHRQQVLGTTPPAQSIAATDVLTSIADAHGFADYMIGYFDVLGITDIFLEPQQGLNASVLTLWEYEDPQLSDVCKAEVRGLLGSMPRITMGYTDMTVERIASKAVFELRDDLAASMQGLPGAVPGMAADFDGLMTFGMSLDLLAARNFYESRLDALEAAPFECELFADLMASVAAGREVLNQPVPPIVYGFKGFLADIHSFDGMDLAANAPPSEVDMRFLVATDNAEGLLAMGAMFSPEIAGLNLESNGEPVRLDVPMLAMTGQVFHVAMTEKALGIAVGEGMEEGLADMLNSAAPDPSPFMVFEMDAERYYAMIGDAMADDAGDLAAMPELQAELENITRAAQEVLDRVAFDILFTEHGVEMISEVTLSD